MRVSIELDAVREALKNKKAIRLFDEAIDPSVDTVEVFFKPHDTHTVIGLQDRVLFLRWPLGKIKWTLPLVMPFGAALAGAMAVGQKSGLGLMAVPYSDCSEVVVQRSGPVWVMEVVVPSLGRAKIHVLYRIVTRPNHWNVFAWMPKRHEENMVEVEILRAMIERHRPENTNLDSPPPPSDLSMQLQRLADLHASGAINESEYAAAKAKLLA